MFQKLKSDNFSFREANESQWIESYNMISHTNLMQSWKYGFAKAKIEKFTKKNYLIFDQNDTQIGIVQVLFKRIFFFINIVRINRGPLYFYHIPKDFIINNNVTIINAFINYVRSNKITLFFVAPESKPLEKIFNEFKKYNYFKRKTEAWGSGLIDLSINSDQLLSRLDGKWRNSMRKAIKNNIKIELIQNSSYNIDLLIDSYRNLQIKKNFKSISEELIIELSKFKTFDLKFNLFVATEINSNDPIGHLVIIKTGDTSLYLLGSVNTIGRKLQANSLLLWESIIFSKLEGSRWFDLGGISNNTPKGIKEFKMGTNPELYTLAGEFVKVLLPKF
jgi:lipid II:glycine glycyltransferase (peptidoglycan interpeptide bridge formation enzyme)